MLKACATFVMIMMLLFGSVGVPAFADAGTGGHAVEILDLECHAQDEGDDNGEGSPAAPAAHVDHHHCSVAIPLGSIAPAPVLIFSNVRKTSFADNPLISHKSAPPTEPPSA